MALFEKPTFGLEPGGTLDRSIGEGELKAQLQIPAGSGQLPADKMAIQGAQALAMSDAVPRSSEPLVPLPRPRPVEPGVGSYPAPPGGWQSNLPPYPAPPAPPALPVQTIAPDPQAEMLLRADQKSKANMLDWAALKEWLNKEGTGDQIEHAWNMFKAGGKDWYEGGIGHMLGGEFPGPGGMKNRLEVQKTREDVQKSKASQSGEKK